MAAADRSGSAVAVVLASAGAFAVVVLSAAESLQRRHRLLIGVGEEPVLQILLDRLGDADGVGRLEEAGGAHGLEAHGRMGIGDLRVSSAIASGTRSRQ